MFVFRSIGDLMKTLLTLLIILFVFQVAFSQEFAEGEYWDSYIYGKTWIGENKNFTKEDVIKGGSILSNIKHSTFDDEWDGIYLSNHDGLGEEVLSLNQENGFVEYYFYHTLKRLDFGYIKKNLDSLILTSEKSGFEKNKSKTWELVKVKYGDRHYLITENNLKLFLEDIVGVFPANAPPYHYSIWLKKDDEEKKIFGVPQIPEKYKYLFRSPLETKITKVGKKIYEDNDIYYFITLGAGINKKIKVGMNLYAADLGEWVEITKVSQNISIGKIRRSFFDEIEECRDNRNGDGDQIPCKEIKRGIVVKTIGVFK